MTDSKKRKEEERTLREAQGEVIEKKERTSRGKRQRAAKALKRDMKDSEVGEVSERYCYLKKLFAFSIIFHLYTYVVVRWRKNQSYLLPIKRILQRVFKHLHQQRKSVLHL